MEDEAQLRRNPTKVATLAFRSAWLWARFAIAAAFLLCLTSCGTKPLTQLVVEIEGDLAIPAQINEIFIAVDGLGAERQEARTQLAEGDSFPRRISLVRDSDEVGEIELSISALREGDEVVTRRVRVAFVEDETRYLRVPLLQSCIDVSCDGDQTCAEGGCRPVLVNEDELSEESILDQDGQRRPDGECLDEELCNGFDDDCDGAVDEGFSLAEDNNNCGACGVKCGDEEQCLANVCRGNNVAWEVRAGDEHVCARTVADTIVCWGNNQSCQLGNFDAAEERRPVPVNGLSDVKDLALGSAHSCALDEEGKVYCWGENFSRQTSTASDNFVCEPRELEGITATQLCAGSRHSCALLENGEVSCWGSNGSGQLGRNAQNSAPRSVEGLPDPAIQITCGRSHSCALLEGGKVYCWGNNEESELGAGADVDESSTPLLVLDLENVQEINAGREHTCARRADGRVACWGENNEGQAGQETPSEIEAAQVVPMLSDSTNVAAGGNHSCATTQAGRVLCFGSDASGQLGNGDGPQSSEPVQVLNISNARMTSIGEAFSCATHFDGSVTCWGSNEHGQAGIGSDADTIDEPAGMAIMP